MGRVFGVLALVSIVLGLVVVLTDRVEDDTSRISLRFSFWGSDTEAAAIEKICRRFEQLRPDVHIITEPPPWGQYWLKMKTQAAGRSGSPPDVIRMTSVASAAWYDRGLLLDLTPYLMRENITLDACFPAAVEAVTWEGRVCSMPTDSAVRRTRSM